MEVQIDRCIEWYIKLAQEALFLPVFKRFLNKFVISQNSFQCSKKSCFVLFQFLTNALMCQKIYIKFVFKISTKVITYYCWAVEDLRFKPFFFFFRFQKFEKFINLLYPVVSTIHIDEKNVLGRKIKFKLM